MTSGPSPDGGGTNAAVFDWAAAHRRLADWEHSLGRSGDLLPDETELVLQERARQLAATPVDAARNDTVEALLFGCGAVVCGVPLEQLDAVVRPDGIVRVPCTPATIRGILNHRGQVLAVIDLAAYLGFAFTTDAADEWRVVVTAAAGGKVGILVEPPLRVESVEIGRLVAVANILLEEDGALSGMAPSLVAMLDAEHLAHDAKVVVNDDGD